MAVGHWGGIPDRGWDGVPDTWWGSSHVVVYQTQVGYQAGMVGYQTGCGIPDAGNGIPNADGVIDMG